MKIRDYIKRLAPLHKATSPAVCFEIGLREGISTAANILLSLRPKMAGLGGPIFILQQILLEKSELPNDICEQIIGEYEQIVNKE